LRRKLWFSCNNVGISGCCWLAVDWLFAAVLPVNDRCLRLSLLQIHPGRYARSVRGANRHDVGVIQYCLGLETERPSPSARRCPAKDACGPWPATDSFGSDDVEGVSPLGPQLRYRHPEGPIARYLGAGGLLLQYRQLLSQQELLEGRIASRPQQRRKGIQESRGPFKTQRR
jgi:hypothetical protein